MNLKLKVFTKKDCPKCPVAKILAEAIAKEKLAEVEFFDVEEADGLAEAQFYSILATPTLILCDMDDAELFSWRGEAPEKEAIVEKINASC